MNLCNHIDFIKSADKQSIDQWFHQLDVSYYYPTDSTQSIDDQTYDYFICQYEKRFGKYTQIGVQLDNHSTIHVPIKLPSLNKIKSTDIQKLNKFSKKYSREFILTNKIDGISGLYVCNLNGDNKLYSRGGGDTGVDISNHLKYIQIPKINQHVYVRGEIYYPVDEFQKDTGGRKNPRNFVAGLMNSKTPESQYLSKCRFIGYAVYFPDKSKKYTLTQQLNFLKKNNFEIPNYMITSTLNMSELLEYCQDQKTKSNYIMDGIVISSIVGLNILDVQNNQNPDHMIAIKPPGLLISTIVLEIEWNPSSLCKLKPVIVISPIIMGGNTYNRVTGHNAGFIYVNQIGPGSEVIISRRGDTIPKVESVIKSRTPQYPDPDLNWYWNDTHTDILLPNTTPEVIQKQNYEFCKQIGAKYIGLETIKKLYTHNYITIKSILELTSDDIIKIPGFKQTSANKVITSINQALDNVSLSVLMSASDTFGCGFGEKKFTTILNVYPDILHITISIDMIQKIPGFDVTTATRFVNNLPKFKQFLNDIPKLSRFNIYTPPTLLDVSGQLNPEGAVLAGKNIVVTGTRNPLLLDTIKSYGGNIKSTVSKNTDYLITDSLDSSSSKMTKVKDKFTHVIIFTVDQFSKKFNL